MGSSTRKIQDKIKKILINDGDVLQIDEGISKAIQETLKLKKSKKYFGDKDFTKLISGGISGIVSIGSGNFKNDYNFDFDFNFEDIESLDPLTVEQIIEIILGKIEETEEIENNLILSAFKISMAELILNGELSTYIFVKNFICTVLYYLIMENVAEAVLEVYEDIQSKDFNNKIKSFACKAVESNMKNTINDFISGKIELDQLIKDIVDLSAKVQGGLNDKQL